MKSIKKTILFLLVLLAILPFFNAKQSNVQHPDYKSLGFIKPINLPLRISGNFCEVRSNHFHSGIDFKTNGTIGHPIYAVADGYVSRIKISPYGYGKALYITHPNGFTTVYAHLSEFEDSLGAYVKRQQYKNELFSVDIYPPKGKLMLTQGFEIAKSGNSGGSSGPHLHFEIRETESEMPVNPLLFKMGILDTIAPFITKLAIYTLNRKSGIINEKGTIKASSKKVLNVKKRAGRYFISNQKPLIVQGKIGFGISAYDKVNNSPNKLGVFSIELMVDDNKIYRIEKDRFSFYETRYVNAHIDYAQKIQSRRMIEKTFVMPGDKLSMYALLEKRGISNFKDNLVHDIQINVEDVHGNMSIMNFKVKSTTDVMIFPKDTTRNKKMIYYNHHNEIKKNDLEIYFPEFSFYESFFFSYNKCKAEYKNVYSDLHSLHNKVVPVHKYYDIKIRPIDLPFKYNDKALIGHINNYGRLVSEGGKWKNGFVQTKTRTFGQFVITIDTILPKVKPLNIYEGKDISNQKDIRFTIWDNFSGIDKFKAYLNEDWVLFEYDAKLKLLTYKVDKKLKKGLNTLRLIVSDEKENVKEVKYNLYKN